MSRINSADRNTSVWYVNIMVRKSVNYRSRLLFYLREQNTSVSAPKPMYGIYARELCTHQVFLGAGCCVSITPYSLHGVSHDNMSRDSDQGLCTEERAGGGKQIYRTHKLRLIPASAIIYNPPYRITFQDIIYGDPNLYEVFFRALLLFECASNAGHVIDVKYGIVEIIV